MFATRTIRRLGVLVGTATLALPVVAIPAHAVGSQLYVSASAASDPACADASQANPFATIAGALACASNGTTIHIGAGTFAGQVSIGANVILRGVGPSTVISRPPGFSNFAPNIAIAAGKNVTLRSLTVDGNGQVTPGIAAGSGRLTVRDVTITGNGNHSGGFGAGIQVAPTTGHATVLVVDSTISNNASDSAGGGIYVNGGGQASTLTVVNSTVSGNSTDGSGGFGGGGIAVRFASLTVRDSTIVSNDDTGNGGGGIFADGNPQPVWLTNTIVAANTAASGGPDCEVHGTRATIDGGHNLIGQNTGAVNTGCPGFSDGKNGDQVGTSGSPIDPVVGTLGMHGGPTPTRALLLGSPAINTGDPADCHAAAIGDLDQRHHKRSSATRLLCDIGAYDTGGTPLQQLYVSKTATSDPGCLEATQANPFATLAVALFCASNGTTITLGPGTFAGQVNVADNVIIQGAGARTKIQRPTGAAHFDPDVTIADGRTVEIRNLTVDGNGQVTPGIAAAGGHLLVRDATISDNANHSPGAGGGIAVVPGTRDADVLVFDSTISNNAADFAGGGIWVGGSSSGVGAIAVVNSTVSGNTADGSSFGGGGVAVGYASLTLRDSTVTANTASSSRGGGIFANTNTPPVSLTNSIVAGNTAPSGVDCAVLASRPIADGGHNLIGQNTGTTASGCPGLTNGVNGDQVGTTAAPIDPVLGPLAANGGPTFTRALLSGSPAIAAADPTDCQLPPVSNHDQRHLLRNAGTRAACDIGAYDTGGA